MERGRDRDRDKDRERDRDRTQRKGAPPRVIIDLSKLSDQEVLVRLIGGRQVRGILKGWDPLLNLVLDQAVEQLRGKFRAMLSFLPSIVPISALFPSFFQLAQS